MSAATFTYVGPQIESVLDYTPEEFGVPGFWLSLIHPGDRDWEPNRSDRDLRDGETYLAGYRMQARDGSFVYLRIYIDVVHDGERIFLAGVLLDVTDRRRASEERRRMMLELDHRVKDSLSTACADREQRAPACGRAPDRSPGGRAQPLGLVLHELALNALVHGALSMPSGEIELRWDRSGGPEGSALRLEWIERGLDSSCGRRSEGLEIPSDDIERPPV